MLDPGLGEEMALDVFRQNPDYTAEALKLHVLYSLCLADFDGLGASKNNRNCPRLRQ